MHNVEPGKAACSTGTCAGCRPMHQVSTRASTDRKASARAAKCLCAFPERRRARSHWSPWSGLEACAHCGEMEPPAEVLGCRLYRLLPRAASTFLCRDSTSRGSEGGVFRAQVFCVWFFCLYHVPGRCSMYQVPRADRPDRSKPQKTVVQID